MIAVDTNILIYAHRKDSPFHLPARACVASLVEGRAAWAIPWPCIHEFLSVSTNPRIHVNPTPARIALDQVEAWMESPSLSLLTEVPDHWPELKRMISAGRITGGRVHDARIAALCITHGVRELWSADRDFSRFAGLRVVNPLVGA